MASNDDFFAKYKDPRWQRKRLEIMGRDGWKCVCCGNSDETLNVHHAYYVKDADPWDYPESALVTLCRSCHEIKHDLKNHVLLVFSYLNKQQMEQLLGYASAQFLFEVGGFTFTLFSKYLGLGIYDYMRPGKSDRILAASEKFIDQRINKREAERLYAEASIDWGELEESEIDDLMFAQHSFNG